MSDVNPVPPPEEDQFQRLLDSLQSNIGRYVAFVLTPILLPLVGAAAVWLQDKIGFDIQSYGGTPAVVGFIVSVVGGLAALMLTWLRNRGKFEAAAAETLNVARAAQIAAASGAAAEGLPVSPDRDWDDDEDDVGDGDRE